MGLLEKLRSLPQRLSARADLMKTEAVETLNKKVGEIREVIGPGKIEPVKFPERPFGSEGAGDVKRIVWAGHKIQSPGGQSYYGAVGLTDQGYYKTAEVQTYGADEKWAWQPERHSIQAEARSKAETAVAVRLKAADEIKPKQKPPAPRLKVMSEEYFPNVWQGKSVQTPSGTLVGVVNIDRADNSFYAGVHHFPKNAEQETAIRWAHPPHATKQEAVQKAEKFIRRGLKSMVAREKEMVRLGKEYREDLNMGRGEYPPVKHESNVLRYKPREPGIHR